MLLTQNRGLILALLLIFTASGCIVHKRYPPPPPFPTWGDMDNKCYYNGEMTATQRRQNFPFNMGYKAMIISFDGYRERAPIDNHSITDSLVYERKMLSQQQIDSLTDVLYNYNYSKDTTIHTRVSYECYAPREAILFIDSSQKVAHWFEICFECRGTGGDIEERYFGDFCDDKFNLIKQFCISIGITHFTDTGPYPHEMIEEPIIDTTTKK